MSQYNSLSERRSHLSPAKQALLKKWTRGTHQTESKIIPKRPALEHAPLSFAQQGLWFLDRLDPDSALYNIASAIQLQGTLDVPALQHSLEEMVRRHEVLRTSFSTVDGQSIQTIAPARSLPLSVVNLQDLPECDRPDAISRLATEAAMQPFDLEQAPLLRATLLVVAEQEHVLLLNLHHIVSDGWSMGVLVRELGVLYSAFCAGKPSPLPDLPIQYADFAAWQRQQMQGTVLENQLSYWTQQLGGAPALLALPTDRPRPPKQTFRGAKQVIALSQTLTQDLKSLSLREGATLFMTLLAAFKTLLYRYTDQEDVMVGSPVANRHCTETEGLIGFFINTVVLRTDLSGNPSFRELLGRVQAIALQAYAHQDLPFDRLLEVLQPDRNLSHNPLFQVMFVLQNTPMPTLALPDLTLSALAIDHPTAKFDLTLELQEGPDGLRGWFEYNTDLFDGPTLARMAQHFQTLLAGVAANPDLPLSHLPLMTASEHQQWLAQWQGRQTDSSAAACLHEIFEAQVERTPDAIALVLEDQHLTYDALNARANRLAHYLTRLPEWTGGLVGFCVERSLDLVVGILAILKAGGAYVPLDPAYPPDRLGFLLEDAAVSIVLTQQACIPSLPSHRARTLCLDSDWDTITTESDRNLSRASTPAQPAYAIYTSGSTGKPKGVLVSHANVVRLFSATRSQFGFDGSEVWTLFHSYAFDFSVWELWGALLHGGRSVVVPYWVSRSPDAFYALLSQQQVTVLNQTPSAFRQLMRAEESLEGDLPLALRFVIFGGEALDLQSMRPWFARHGDQHPQLVNMYGITETTVHVTYRPLAIADLESPASVIGCPIADLEIYVLDRHHQPVPVGIPGEMYIGGAGLACGYLNRPDLTAERFIQHPFSADPAARLYKSGDLARYLANGDLEYLGRIDDQVKVRGFRIELGEIEATLAQHPEVRESVVLLRQEESGKKRLAAYVVPRQPSALTVADLHRFVKERLPDYMVPAVFVLLETLPLTLNGKVDRQKLPVPDAARPDLEATFAAPRTPDEQSLATIWAQVLGLEQVGIHDNFFALGGDSILSLQVQSLAKQQGLNVSIQQLYQQQTIANLAQDRTTADLPAPEAQDCQPFSLLSPHDRSRLPAGIEDAYPLTMLQTGMLFHSEYRPDSAEYHDIFSYCLQAPLDLQILQSTLQYLADRHPVLRTSFHLAEATEPLQFVHRTLQVPLAVADLSHLSPSEQEDALSVWFETEKGRHFDWTHPPLIRFQVHRCSETTFYLTLSFHHAILDGWSMASLLTELLRHYATRLGIAAPVIAPSPSGTFRDFVALERQAIATLDGRRYWIEKLRDSSIAMLPRWSAAQQEAESQPAGVEQVSIPAEISDGLKQLAKSLGVPLKSVLLAAHLRVLSLLSGQSDVVTGLVANGRPEQTDSDRVLGLFLNTLPLRLNLTGGTWIDLIQQVFATEQESLPFRRYPLAQIQLDVGRQPLFQTAFNFLHFHVYQGVLELEQVKLRDIKFFEETNFTFTASFSLNLSSSQVELRLNYDGSEFSSAQIETISGYYARTLTAMVDGPRDRYELQSLLSVQEQQRLLPVFPTSHNAPLPPLTSLPNPYPCIHQLFEAQAERTPDAVALAFVDQQLTYGELNHRANQWAHHLMTLGVGPDVLVGVCLERSVVMVVALLAILKAGGAYVPLDPSYPQPRLVFMLEDTKASVLLTQEKLLDLLPQTSTQTIYLDRWSPPSGEDERNPINRTTAANLAYIIYTSGSTGIPKGIAIEHRSTTALLHWARTLYPPDQIAGILACTSICFDLSVFEIFVPLSWGGTVILALDALQLPSLPAAHAVTLINTVPSAIAELLWMQGIPASVQTVNLAGEPLRSQLVDQIYAQGTVQQVYDLYGPSEDTTYSTVALRRSNGPQTIGRPIAQTQTYILDRHYQPVPVGVPGELYIGGAGLARGYLNRPDLSAAKFIPNPFSNQPGTRLCKTGDLARYLPDDTIEFLGRLDNQVKIRGYRIELGEIEAALLKHPALLASVVIAQADDLGAKRLVAYIVPHHESLTASEFRRFLQTHLPYYMIPSVFVPLDTLPLMPNGKVDHRALLTSMPSEEPLKEGFVAPRDSLELQLAQIWEEVLEVHPVGVQDNFFDLGGHSLLAVRLMARIQQKIGKTLSLVTLFQSPTVENLASLFRQQSETQPQSPLIPIQPAGSQRPFFCVHPVGGNILCYADLARHLNREQPFYGLQSPGLEGEQVPLTRIEDMARHYLAALQTIQPQGPYRLGGWSLGGVIAFEMAQQLHAAGHETELLALIDSSVPVAINPPEDESEAIFLASLLQDLGELFDKDLAISVEDLQLLSSDGQLNRILQEAKRANLVPPELGVQQLRRLLQVFKANLQALSRYRPQSYLGRITFFQASEQVPAVSPDPARYWGDLAAGGIEIHRIPGDHDAILREPQVQLLAEQLSADLNRASESGQEQEQ